MARLLDMQKKKGGAAQGGNDKPAARPEPLSEGRAEATVAARPLPAAPAASQSAELPEVSPSMFVDAPETPVPQAVAPAAASPAPASAPVSAPGGSPHVIDEELLMKLPQEAFLNFSLTRLEALGLASSEDILMAAIENPEVAAIIKAAKARNALPALLQQSPGPQGQEPQRITITSGERSGPVSAYDATMASDIAPLSSQPPPPPPTRRAKPPPPPQRAKVSEPPPVSEATRDLPLSEMGKFMQELKDSGDSTKDRYDRAVTFFQAKRDEALKAYGKDALGQAAVSAKQKLQAESGAVPALTPQEQFMLELGELNKLIGWLKKRMDDERGVHDAMKANGKDKPAVPSVPPAAPAPASAAPAPAQAAQAPAAKQQAETQAPESAGPSKHPSAPPSAKPRAGAVARFFSNYTTWSVAGIGAFTGALVYTNQFRDLAIGAKKIFEYASGRSIADIPNAWTIGVYSGVMASIVIIGTLVTRARARRMAERARIRAERSDADKAKMEFVLRKLSQIMLKNAKAEDQISQIRQELRSDEAFFAAMYFLRKDSVFDDILEEARVSDKLRGMIRSVLLPRTELEIMQRKLKRFADIVYSPRERANLFRKMYEDDAAFRLISDELFLRNISGDIVNGIRAKDVFSYVENNQQENVGEPLQKALQQDFDDIISTKK